MLKKFLFYFAIFLCTGGLLCRCTKKKSPEDQLGSLVDVRWLPAQPLASNFSELSFKTLSKEGLFRLSEVGFETSPMPQVVQRVNWSTKKIVEIELKPEFKGFTAPQAVEGLRKAFHSDDSLLVEAMSELIQNGREYAQGRISFPTVGIRALNERTVQITLRRHAPALLGLVLSHPATWPETSHPIGPLQTMSEGENRERHFAKNLDYRSAPVRMTAFQARQVEDPFTRTTLVLNGEADFTGEITLALLTVAKKTDRYRELFSAMRLFLILNPSRQPLRAPAFRKELAHSIDPRELARFIPNLLPISRLLERKPTAEKVGWFASLEQRSDRRPLSGVTTSFKLRAVLPYPHPDGLAILSEVTNNLTAQLGKVGVNVEALSPSFQIPSSESLAEPDLTLFFMPALPLASVSWAEIFSFLNRRNGESELESLLGEWEQTRDDERLEIAVENYLSDQVAMLVPLGADRKAFLASPRLHTIRLSPFGFWDWSRVALAFR